MRNLCLLFLVALTTGLVSDKLLVASQSSSLTADDLYLEGHTSGGLPIDDEDAEDTEDFNSGSGSGDYGFIEKSDKEDVLRKFLDFSTASPDKKVSPTEPTRSVAQSTRRPAVKDVEVTPSVSLTDNDYDKKVPEASPTEDRSRNKPNTPSSTPAESTTVGININVVEKEEDDNSLDRWDDSKNKDQEKEEEKPEEEEDNEIKRAKMMDGNYNQVTSESMWERTEVLAAVIACVVVGCVCAIFLLFILAYRMKKKDEGSYDLGDTKISATAYQKAPTKEFYA